MAGDGRQRATEKETEEGTSLTLGGEQRHEQTRRQTEDKAGGHRGGEEIDVTKDTMDQTPTGCCDWLHASLALCVT